MNEPSDQAREVLARYRDAIGPTSAERAALVVGVRRAIASGAGPSAVASAVAVGRRTPWLVLVGVTAVVAGGAWWSTRVPDVEAPAVAATSEPPAASPPAPTPAVAMARSPMPATLPTIEPPSRAAAPTIEPASRAAAPTIEPPAAAPTVVRPAARRGPAPAAAELPDAAPPEIATVDAEVALLREASVALKRGDDATARGRYDEHTRRFPDGALVELREVGLALLDCRADPAAAPERARRFAARYPGSPHLVRIERECAP